MEGGAAPGRNDWRAGGGAQEGPLLSFPTAPAVGVGGGRWGAREGGGLASSKEPVNAAQKLDLLE